MNKKYTIGVIAIMTLIALGTTTLAILVAESAYGIRVEGGSFGVVQKSSDGNPAKFATSGDNVYIAWGTNNTVHPEIMFRASTDGGKTFGEKINLSNTSNVDSVDREIAASGSNVFVAWWERGNQTNNEAVMKISTDNGKTFGPMLKLAANGTIGSSSGG
jgi:hypothetical protein